MKLQGLVPDVQPSVEPSIHAGGQKMTIARKARAYFELTKPRVIELLLVTTLPTMIFAQPERGTFPSFWVIVATMIGGALAAGSAGAFNCYLDRDIDKVMHRTERRPLVTGEVKPTEALVFATVLGIASLVVLFVGTNLLATFLGAAAIFFYVVVYTLVLKRRTKQNIIWGGIAGCMPVLIAWAAVRDSIEWAAIILFLIIFLWTPPHYWPLSMKYRQDYSAAQVPMLGAVAAANTVSIQVVLYAWATVACSLLLIPLGHAGWVYTAVALISGSWFIIECHRLHNIARENPVTDKTAMKVFHASISYLSLLFLALAIDPFVGPTVFGH